MKRIVEPEWLDELPPSDPRAIRSRQDLRRINFFMSNVRLMERMLKKAFPQAAPKQIVELGAGDGTFMLEIARRFSGRWKNVEIILVDRQSLLSTETTEEFQQLGWPVKMVCSDVFDWLSAGEKVGCVMANLFLHHFEDEKLSDLLRLASEKADVFLTNEPSRSQLGILGTNFLGLIGCNDVTRHDAEVSVHAGFRADELSKQWPQNADWKCEERNAGLFSHIFVATRK